MTSTSSPLDAPRPFLAWQGILDWAQEHYRYRTFSKDERIPARSGLLYLVQQGVVRLVGTSQVSSNKTHLPFRLSPQPIDEAFLGFVSIGQPFEIVAPSPFAIDAYAHIDRTSVVWLYWNELDNWPLFRREVMDAFRYQHQRKLLWLTTLGQRRTIDRLLGFLTLLIEEFGEPCDLGYCLPFPLTHAQLGCAIGSTRVTVTRLMGKLYQRKLIYVKDDRLICLPVNPNLSGF
jgi:CRP-like cAMP-binding protein